MSLTDSRADPRGIRRVIAASFIGTTIEWYDFFLYGTAAALVFPKLFFPGGSEAAGVLESFGTFFVGFAARPIGAAIFGHYGDRIGRKATLVATLLLMGIGTFLVGLVPPYANIGILAKRMAGVRVAIPAREVAGSDLQTDTVARLEYVAGGP